MTSYATIRDPRSDHLLTPQNAALLIIDYQPTQVSSLASRDKRQLLANVVATAKVAQLFGLPIVLSTVNVENGVNPPTVHQLTEVLQDCKPIDRTAINAWEDKDFVEAVAATGRKKLLIAALWTEVCMAFPALDAMKDGFEVYPVVDAIAGTSLEAHEAGIRRVELAGAKPTSWVQLACELQRDWNRPETAKAFGKLLGMVEGD
jgi:nicotinamidase-related amidase